jgi:hypothetical protein
MEVDACVGVVARLGEGDPVESCVQLPVTCSVEAVANVVG